MDQSGFNMRSNSISSYHHHHPQQQFQHHYSQPSHHNFAHPGHHHHHHLDRDLDLASPGHHGPAGYMMETSGEDEFECNKDKLWYRKFKKALHVLEEDIYQKSVKIDEIRRNVSTLKSRSSRLIFKEVDFKVRQLKKSLNNFHIFFHEMNKLEVKYEAIVYDIDDRDRSLNQRTSKNTKDTGLLSSSPSPPPPLTPSIPTEAEALNAGSSPGYQLTDSSPLSHHHSHHVDTVSSSPSLSLPPTPHCPTQGSTPSRDSSQGDDRSEDFSANLIKTPIKNIRELHGYASPVPSAKRNDTDSPRSHRTTPRKSYTPRRRGLSKMTTEQQQVHISTPHSDPPSESGSSVGEPSSEDVHVKGDAIMEELINHPVLHEKLAQTINRVFNGENMPLYEMNDYIGSSDFHSDYPDNLACSSSPDRTLTEEGNNIEANEIQLPETAIQDILNGIESDPVFNDLLNICSTKQDIISNNGPSSSPLTQSSYSLTTPKSSDYFKSPLSTPIRNYSDVVKDLMKDLKTPEKKTIPSSPLSTAIESSINDSGFNLSDSSPLLPVLDFNVLMNSQSNSQTALVPASSLPLSLDSGNCTYVIAQTSRDPDATLTPSSGNKLVTKKVLKGKRINLDKIENSNLQGLRKKRGKFGTAASAPVAVSNLRKIFPKSTPTTTTIERINEPSVGQESNKTLVPVPRIGARVNLRQKFEANSKNTSSESRQGDQATKDKPASSDDGDDQPKKPQKLLASQLLKNMNVDQFLSKVHEERS